MQGFLPLIFRPWFTKDAWVIHSGNRDVTLWLERWPDWHHHRMLWLWGESGSGKTHLTSIWKERANAELVTFHEDLWKNHPLDILTPGCAYLVEWDGENINEPWIFHFFNYAHDLGCDVVWVSRRSPRELSLELPDLTSRLLSLVAFSLCPLEDFDELLDRWLKERAILLPLDRQRWLLDHIESSANHIKAWVDRIVDHTEKYGRSPSRNDLSRLWNATLSTPTDPVIGQD